MIVGVTEDCRDPHNDYLSFQRERLSKCLRSLIFETFDPSKRVRSYIAIMVERLHLDKLTAPLDLTFSETERSNAMLAVNFTCESFYKKSHYVHRGAGFSVISTVVLLVSVISLVALMYASLIGNESSKSAF